MGARRCAVLAVAVVAAWLLAAPAPAGADPGDEDWRGWMNQARSEAGLSPVVENPAWSDGARKHGLYAVRNQWFRHDEDPTLPHHTPEGQHAARTGNLFASSARRTPRAAIDGWLESPGHALWILHPNATAAGYGEFHDPNQTGTGDLPWTIRWVAVLPVVDGVDWSTPMRAFTYPQEGATSLRNPGHLYAAFATAPSCPCTSHVAVDGVAVRSSAGKYREGGDHGHSVVVELDERVPDGSLVSVHVATADGQTRQWLFGVGRDVPLTHPVYRDVLAGTWFHDAVDWAAEQAITTGTSPTTFGPHLPVTRAQAVTFLWRAAGSPAPADPGHGYTDVPVGAYYDAAVAWAREQGVTTGTSPSTFSPHDVTTRAQMITFLWRAQGRPAAGLHGFADVPVGAFYDRAVGWAVERAVTTGTSPSTFSPHDTVTRAQAVTFLWRTAGRPERSVSGSGA
jgi:hypothetical protein